MKKLLVLALVLSMATMASASLQLAVGTDKTATDVTITTVPSGTISLGIWTNADIIAGVQGEDFWAIGAQMSGATNAGGVSLITTDSGVAIFDDGLSVGIQYPNGEDGVWGTIALGTIPSIASGTMVYNAINLHCEGPGNVILSLYLIDGDDGSIMATTDTLTVHQTAPGIPEPFTMALLGLGGLFLRRRK